MEKTPAALTLEQGDTKLVVTPQLGAGIASLAARRDGRWLPLMRPAQISPATAPLDLACVLMAPWVNRISGGGFTHRGRRVALRPNLPGQDLPLHGNALLEPWTVAASEPERVELALRSRGPSLYDYSAQVSYALEDDALQVSLTVRHEGDGSLPYGIGLHPWFVRTADTWLLAPAAKMCLMDERLLPAACVAVGRRPPWDFNAPAPLPDGLIDNPFAGWNGRATIDWRDRGLALDIEASATLAANYQVYSPGPAAGFVCFEPVSHAVDEHNQPQFAASPGLRELAAGEEVSGSVVFRLRPS